MWQAVSQGYRPISVHAAEDDEVAIQSEVATIALKEVLCGWEGILQSTYY